MHEVEAEAPSVESWSVTPMNYFVIACYSPLNPNYPSYVRRLSYETWRAELNPPLSSLMVP